MNPHGQSHHESSWHHRGQNSITTSWKSWQPRDSQSQQHITIVHDYHPTTSWIHMTAKRSLPQHHETHDNHETQSQKQITIVHDYHKTNSIHHMPLFTLKWQLIQPNLNPKLLHGSQTTGPRNHKTQGCYRIPLFAPACRPVGSYRTVILTTPAGTSNPS